MTKYYLVCDQPLIHKKHNPARYDLRIYKIQIKQGEGIVEHIGVSNIFAKRKITKIKNEELWNLILSNSKLFDQSVHPSMEGVMTIYKYIRPITSSFDYLING